MLMENYPPAHEKSKSLSDRSFSRLLSLWERYPKYHEQTVFTTLEQLLAEHESYQEDFDDFREEYEQEGMERFLVQLSWSDLPYRYHTMQRIQTAGPLPENPYVKAFMQQFEGIDTDQKACFLFPESCVSQFFVIMEVSTPMLHRRFLAVIPSMNIPCPGTIHIFAMKERCCDLRTYRMLWRSIREICHFFITLPRRFMSAGTSHIFWKKGISVQSWNSSET